MVSQGKKHQYEIQDISTPLRDLIKFHNFKKSSLACVLKSPYSLIHIVM